MRKMRKTILILGATITLIMLAISVSAESDPEGDVYHQTVSDSKYSYELFGTRDHIDITDISLVMSGTNVTLSLTVKDSIDSDNENIFYYAHIKAKGMSSTDQYQFYYTQGQGIVTASGEFTGYYDTEPDFILSADGKTVSYIFTDINTSVEFEPWGYAIEHLDYADNSGGEAWLDYAPGTYTNVPWGTSEDTNGNGEETGGEDGTPTPSTPGFEIITLIAAIGIIFFILKRRK